MNNIFRGLLAGYGAKKLGGGCTGTKIAHYFLEKKLDKTPFEWDSKNKELKID